MTGDLPYPGTYANYPIMAKIFGSDLPEVDGQLRLGDCLQAWELMRRCWSADPEQQPTAKMCKTTVTYLPRSTPTPSNSDHQTQSAALLESLGDLESWKGNQAKSSAYLNEALQLYQDEADTKGIASVLLKQAKVAERICDFVRLRAIASTALEHFRALNDALGITDASYYLGLLVQMLSSDLEKALPILRETLEIRRAHQDDVGVVPCLERMANIQRCKGQLHEALSTLDEAMAIATRSGDQLGRANVLLMMGLTHIALSDFFKAAKAFSEAITITRNVGWDGELSVNVWDMGRLKMCLGEHCEAEELFQESISIARRIRSRYNLAYGLKELGKCFTKQSKLKEAASVVEESCLLFEELAQQGDLQAAAAALVEVKIRQGDWDGALFWYDHIISFCRSQNVHQDVADHLVGKGEILAKLQQYDEAALHFEAAMGTRRENGYTWPKERSQLCAIPKTVMQWERRSPLLCDLKKLQRRQPQLKTATLKLPVPFNSGEP